MAQFDHLVVAVRSLDEGVAEFERLTGIKAGVGGKHLGRGTENALVSFGVDGVTYATGPVRIEVRFTCGGRTATLTTPG